MEPPNHSFVSWVCSLVWAASRKEKAASDAQLEAGSFRQSLCSWTFWKVGIKSFVPPAPPFLLSHNSTSKISKQGPKRPMAVSPAPFSSKTGEACCMIDLSPEKDHRPQLCTGIYSRYHELYLMVLTFSPLVRVLIKISIQRSTMTFS